MGKILFELWIKTKKMKHKFQMELSMEVIKCSFITFKKSVYSWSSGHRDLRKPSLIFLFYSKNILVSQENSYIFKTRG